MPIFTRRSREGTFQIISARLSKNGKMVTFASDTSLPRHTSTSWCGWLRRCGGSVFWFLRTILGLVADIATVSLRTLAFFFPLVTYLFLLQRRLVLFDSLPLLLIQFSHIQRQSFVIEVSDQYSPSPWFLNFDIWETVSSDESPSRTIPIRFWVDQTHVSSICTDFPRYHRMELLHWTTELRPILYRIPECCQHEQQQRINQRNLILYHERQLLESGRRSWRRSVFLVETDPLFGLLLLEADLLLEMGILDGLVQRRCNLRVQHLQIWKILSTNWSRRFWLVQRINHLHFPDSQHGIRWKIRTGSHLVFGSYLSHQKDCGLGNLSNGNSDICCPTM